VGPGLLITGQVEEVTDARRFSVWARDEQCKAATALDEATLTDTNGHKLIRRLSGRTGAREATARMHSRTFWLATEVTAAKLAPCLLRSIRSIRFFPYFAIVGASPSGGCRCGRGEP
jgi:hypothetical protein